MERVTGQAPEPPGNFIEPTIMLARNDLPIAQQEIFAPIPYHIPYNWGSRRPLVQGIDFELGG